jgi:hypothetical protein
MCCHLPVRLAERVEYGKPPEKSTESGDKTTFSSPVTATPGATKVSAVLEVSFINALPDGAPVVPFSHVYTEKVLVEELRFPQLVGSSYVPDVQVSKPGLGICAKAAMVRKREKKVVEIFFI